MSDQNIVPVMVDKRDAWRSQEGELWHDGMVVPIEDSPASADDLMARCDIEAAARTLRDREAQNHGEEATALFDEFRDEWMWQAEAVLRAALGGTDET